MNGDPVQEFNAPVSDTVSTTWVPTTNADILTVDAGCNVGAKKVSFDLVVDSILRSTLTSSNKEYIHKRHSLKISSVLHMHESVVTSTGRVMKDLP